MLSESVFGKLYGLWLDSAVFSLLQRIFALFSNAYRHSAIVRVLTRRRSRIEDIYESSLLSRLMRAVFNLLLYIPKRLFAASKNICSGSVILRWCTGSVIINFETLFGLFLVGMFVIPHESWSNTYALLASAGFFVLFGLMAAAGKRRVLYPNELGLPLMLFVLSCVLSLLYTGSLGDSVRVLTFYATSFLLLYVIAADVTDIQRLKKLLGFIFAAVIVTSLIAIAQRIAGVEVNESLIDVEHNKGVPGRVYSTLSNPNNYAEFLVLFMPVAAAWAITLKNNAARFVCSCSIALPMLAMLMTYSRSCWLSIALTAVVFVYYSNKRLVPLMFLACILALPFLPASIWTRIMSMFNTQDTSISHRFYIWRGILQMLRFNCNWLTGIGAGPETFAALYPHFARSLATKGVVHSQMQYMEMLLEFGVLGFVSFMWMMLRSIKDSALALYRSRSPLRRYSLAACCSSFIGINIAYSAEYVWYYPRVMFAFFILLGICMALPRMDED